MRDELAEDDEHEWVALDSTDLQGQDGSYIPRLSLDKGPCETIAAVSTQQAKVISILTFPFQYIITLLPPRPPPPPGFSVKRLRLTTHRVYLALEPAYFPIIARLLNLATWQSYGSSLFYCLVSGF